LNFIKNSTRTAQCSLCVAVTQNHQLTYYGVIIDVCSEIRTKQMSVLYKQNVEFLKC